MMKILVTNDDGIDSRGIALLVECAREFGEVTVVAPDQGRSGMSHAITINNILRIKERDMFGEDVKAISCSGTPVDCVKIAHHHVMGLETPDLVLSGINHGSNTSISVLYSGTMAAAIEATLEGMMGIGFSLCDYDSEAKIDHLRPYIIDIIGDVVKNGLPESTTLNVNFPAFRPSEPIAGMKYCRQAKAKWLEKFDERQDPYNGNYFWMSGDFVNTIEDPESDEWAIKNNYGSIVPCKHDLTDYSYLKEKNE